MWIVRKSSPSNGLTRFRRGANLRAYSSSKIRDDSADICQAFIYPDETGWKDSPGLRINSRYAEGE